MSARNPSPSKDWGNGSRFGESRALRLGEDGTGGTEHNTDGGINNMSNTNHGKAKKVIVNTSKIDNNELSLRNV
jgi:hypothetical protein